MNATQKGLNMSNFDPTPYLPTWAKAQSRPMQQALHFIFSLTDAAPGVNLQLGALRHPGTPDETMREIGIIDGSGGTTTEDLRGLLTACRAENAGRHSNILVRPDPAQDHPWLLIDDLPTARALALTKEIGGLAVETSKWNCQVRVLSDRNLDQQQRGSAQKTLQDRLQSDPGSVQGEKWGRLPGFTNQKQGKSGQWTNLLADTTGVHPKLPVDSLFSLHPPGGGVYIFASLSPAVLAAPSRQPAAGSLSAANEPHTKQDHAREALAKPLPLATENAQGWRQEYADCCQALRANLPHAEIAAMLAARSLERGKRSTPAAAQQYAQMVLNAAMRAQQSAA
jgi:hypothetical protein